MALYALATAPAAKKVRGHAGNGVGAAGGARARRRRRGGGRGRRREEDEARRSRGDELRRVRLCQTGRAGEPRVRRNFFGPDPFVRPRSTFPYTRGPFPCARRAIHRKPGRLGRHSAPRPGVNVYSLGSAAPLGALEMGVALVSGRSVRDRLSARPPRRSRPRRDPSRRATLTSVRARPAVVISLWFRPAGLRDC
jgi:hypothetical protein